METLNNETVTVNNIKPGWMIITKDKNTGKIIFKRSDEKLNPYISMTSITTSNTSNNTSNNTISSSDRTYYLDKMINNWNRHREYDIEILGDRSIYFNYKEELKEMLDEEEYIADEINNKYEMLSDDSYYSDS